MRGIQNKHEIAKVLHDLLLPSIDTDLPVFSMRKSAIKADW